MKHYFILEDHKEQAEALAKILHSYHSNIKTTIALSITEALQKIKEVTYDLFFWIYNFPLKNNFPAMESLLESFSVQ